MWTVQSNYIYLVPPRIVAYTLQEPLKEKQDSLQKQQIIVPLCMDKTSELSKSFVLVPKANSKVRPCLDMARLNKVLIRHVHRGSTLYDILLQLAGIKYLTLIDTSSGYHNLKLDEKSSYLTSFSCQFGRHRCTRLPFVAVPVKDTFQKIDELFSGMLYTFCIADFNCRLW